MTGVIATIPRTQFLSPTGAPLAGGTLTTYLAGTTTLEATYQDQALTIKNQTTITLDATGSCALWLDPAKSYKFLLKNALGVTQPGWPVDDISGASNLTSLEPTLGQYAKLSKLATPEGAKLTGFGSRNVHEKLSEDPSVLDRDTPANGEDDDTPAFSAAAKDAITAVLEAIGSTVQRAPVGRVKVPAGTYRLLSFVDTGGADIEWMLDPGAVIGGIENLPGIVRVGTIRHSRPMTHGTFDTAVGHAVIVGSPADTPPSVLGISSPSELGSYPDGDSVGQFVANTAPPPLFTLTAPAYTGNTVSCPMPVDVRRLRVGMIIDTAHDPKYRGEITGWAANGSSITVSGWYQLGGGGGAPPSGVDAYVNAITKIFGGNTIAVLTPASHAKKAAVHEFDMVNNQGHSARTYSTDPGSAQTWGADSVNIGQYTATAAFTARGNWWNDYIAASGAPGSTGFQVVGLQDIGFHHRNGRGIAYYSTMNEIMSFAVMANGCMEVGRQDAAQATFIDLHSSGNANDFDARIAVSGGTVASGGGTITYTAASHQFNGPLVTGNVFPGASNVNSLGLPSNLYTQLFAASGTINTSDRRAKDLIQDADAAALRAVAKIEFKQFKYKDSITAKGDSARWHFGVIAQDVQAAFELEGLDPFAYGLLCYDEWPDEWVDHPAEYRDSAILDAAGKPQQILVREAWRQKVRDAGNRYGVRYDELFALKLAAIAAS